MDHEEINDFYQYSNRVRWAEKHRKNISSCPAIKITKEAIFFKESYSSDFVKQNAIPINCYINSAPEKRTRPKVTKAMKESIKKIIDLIPESNSSGREWFENLDKLPSVMDDINRRR